MLKNAYLLLVVLNIILPQQVYGGDETARILRAWKRHYGAFAEREQYHYRCLLTRKCKTPDPSFDRFKLEPKLELGLEFFRLGQACRMDVISGSDFSAFDTSAWTRIFDGRAGITSQPQGGDSRYFQIYPADHDLEAVRERVEPYADPLADVLGLSVDASTTSWALGIPPDLKPFDLATALAQGQFQVTSQSAEWIELRNAENDQVTLSVRQNYAIVRRTWTWTLDTKLKCSIENRDWKQFSDGTWYPQTSKFICARGSGADYGQELLVVDYHFSALAASKQSDFEVTVDHAGADVEYYGPKGDRRSRAIKTGESIDLTQLAHNRLSIRWDNRDLPYSLLEKWSIVPLAAVIAFLAFQRVSKGRAQSRGSYPQRAIWLSLLFAGAFWILIHSAMWIYHGSTINDKEMTSYSWTYNYLSDLGREYRYDEGDNFPVSALFVLALSAAGAGTLIYAWHLPQLFHRRLSRRIAILASLFGLVAGWSYIRIGWAPLDIRPDEHRFYASSAFIAYGVMSLFYAAALLLERGYPRRYGWSLLAFCLLLATYESLRLFSGALGWPGGLLWQATSQKIVVHSQMFCMTILAIGALKWLGRQANEETK
jgi:hypothetical protein